MVTLLILKKMTKNFNSSEMLIYQTEDGFTKIETRLENETVWLSIVQMPELFQKSRSTIDEHIINVFNEGELGENLCLRKIGISDYSTKPSCSEFPNNCI